MDKCVLQQGRVQAVGGFHQEQLIANSNVYQIQHSVAADSGNLQHLGNDSRDLSLQNWIKGALDSIARSSDGGGISSMDYLKPSLRIALSLAEQVSEAEHCARNNIFDKLGLLPIGNGSDWTSHVMVRLKKDGSQTIQRADSDTNPQVESCWDGDDAWLHEPLPFAAGTTGGEMEATQDMNQQLEALLESYGVDALEETSEVKFDGPSEMGNATGEVCQTASLKTEGLEPEHKTESLQEQQHEDQMWSVAECFRQPSPMALSDIRCHDEKIGIIYDELDAFLKCHLDEPDTSTAVVGDQDYLNVESAEIQCPERQPIIDAYTVADERKRIFQLGLVFYVLFTGGETPPPGLLALASSDGAFISLLASTLTDNTGDACELSNKSKRHLSSRSDERIGRQVSLEDLQVIGVPSQLCNLIFNMLDCIYRDLSNYDYYTDVNYVTSDLQLMLAKPHKFLQGLDMGSTKLSGFHLNEAVFCREQEFACIQACYRRSVTESYELAMIAGLSGTGKSWLAQRLGRFIVAQGGLFLFGKFDQMQSNHFPFSALASAFDHYCDVLISNTNADWVTLVVDKLQQALGNDLCHLIAVIPKLSQILPHDSVAADTAHHLDSIQALQRLCYLICQFVEVISKYSLVSVTLCLDDIQWCDEATMLVLNQLLIKRYNKFFFLGCYRSDEMNDDHPMWKTIHNVRLFGANTTTVKLDCVKKDVLNGMVSDLLCLPPRQVTSLTEILHKKTKGNPLFVVQLMLLLNRDGLLYLSLVRQRWNWDEEGILCMKLPENVAICFADGIRQLPPDVRLALCTLSLFGASTKDEYIHALESMLDLNLTGPLTMAASEGLITHMKGSYHFCHDRIQEACYGMMNEQDRRRDHSLYGLCLVKSALQSENDDMLFIAVNQINFGGPSAVLETTELAAMARYNLLAAKSAIHRSDFSSAYYFTSNGIIFLQSSHINHWVAQYHLSLELFEIGCQNSLATGNIHSLYHLAGEAINHAQCFEDKLNIYSTILTSLIQLSKVSEALDKNRRILAQLGEVIPNEISNELLNKHIQQTQAMIRGISESDLLNYRLMTDNRTLTTLKYLAKLETMALLAKPTLHPYITLRMVQLTISHGLSPMSAIGFAHFGSLLAKQGSIRAGYKFALLAKNLLDKLGAKDIAGEVITILAEIQCFVEPVEASNELRVECELAAMAVGDALFACHSRLQYCLTLFWAGSKLSVVNEAGTEACRFMQELGDQVCLFFMQVGQRSALKLVGSESEAVAGKELFKRAHEAKNPRQLLVLSFHDLYLSFILDDGDAIKECCEKFIAAEKSSYFLFFGDTMQAFIVGLASLRIYRETRCSLWLERARKYKSDMKLWSDDGSQWNFKHKLLLLQAEEYYSIGDYVSAQDFYNKAIQTAKSHKAINDEALSCELTAKFYMETNEQEKELRHLRLALKKYLEWGALAKADLLFELIEKKIGSARNSCADGNADIDACNIDLNQRKRRAM